MSSQPGDYSVGWICAIETEFVVACELLDEEYSRKQAPRLPLDQNVYRFGRIHEHKVVIACLPKGRYGTNSAALVASQMLQSFPSIRIGLMVGIGGGAPSHRHDIRLGDIVVSSPTPRNGGVVQYDFGKALQNQEFNITGHLAAPPRALLNALTAIHAEHERKGHRILDTIQNMIAKNKRLEKKYSRPAIELDRLYETPYNHSKQEDCECLREDSATETPSRFLIERRVRNSTEDDPAIHYGLIASANTLVKDGILRDQLTKDHDILCFEMEAAGVMNDFPCVVIRGICDYSDSHKNDIWHGYAAAAAASYAKELLEMIPGTEVQDTPPTQPGHASRPVDIGIIHREGSLSTQDTVSNPTEHIDLYKVLNVSKDATIESINTAHLELLRGYPQDVNGCDLDLIQRDMLDRIWHAYQVLSDAVQRERYDMEMKLSKLKQQREREREREPHYENVNSERLVRDRAVRSVSQSLPTPWSATDLERILPVVEESHSRVRAARTTSKPDSPDVPLSRMKSERKHPLFNEARSKEQVFGDSNHFPLPFTSQSDADRAKQSRPDSASGRFQNVRETIPMETQETSRKAAHRPHHHGFERTRDAPSTVGQPRLDVIEQARDQEDSEVENFMLWRDRSSKQEDTPRVNSQASLQGSHDARSRHRVKSTFTYHPPTEGRGKYSSTPARTQNERRDRSNEAVVEDRRRRDDFTQGVTGDIRSRPSLVPEQRSHSAAAAANTLNTKSNKENNRVSPRIDALSSPPRPTSSKEVSSRPHIVLLRPRQSQPAAQGEQQHRRRKKKITRTVSYEVSTTGHSNESSFQPESGTSRVSSWLKQQSKTISPSPTRQEQNSAKKLHQATAETDSDEEE